MKDNIKYIFYLFDGKIKSRIESSAMFLLRLLYPHDPKCQIVSSL